jgi:NADH-quinone oxidoreductase subunit F
MTGPIKLEISSKSTPPPHVSGGRIIRDLLEAGTNAADGLAAKIVRESGHEAALNLLDQAGIRGRAGGGFPTGHKWWLVASQEAGERYFVCNANGVQPGGYKEGFLLRANPYKVVEAVTIATHCVGAKQGFLCLPQGFVEETAVLEDAIRRAHESGLLGTNALGSENELDLKLIKTPDSYLAGEESALLEFIEGKPLQPRGKPPLPTDRGLFGKPTVVNNLETVLQCRYALKAGAQAYREIGTRNAPGTMMFSLSGEVNRPGLYELPLGTPLRQLIFSDGEGIPSQTDFKAAFPGGIASAIMDRELLDTPLDFDSLRDVGSDLGSGVVMVFGQEMCMVDLALQVARFFSDASCGKCLPCKDGTKRTHTMLTRLDHLNESSVDLAGVQMPPSKRHPQLTVLNNTPRGISYTDTVKGLDKITHLCEFFKYRGDCNHSNEAATTLISLVSKFRREFDYHMQFGSCDLATKMPSMQKHYAETV